MVEFIKQAKVRFVHKHHSKYTFVSSANRGACVLPGRSKVWAVRSSVPKGGLCSQARQRNLLGGGQPVQLLGNVPPGRLVKTLHGTKRARRASAAQHRTSSTSRVLEARATTSSLGLQMGSCTQSGSKLQVTCPAASINAFEVSDPTFWANVSSSNQLCFFRGIYSTYHYDNNKNVDGGAHTCKTFTVNDLTTATLMMDQKSNCFEFGVASLSQRLLLKPVCCVLGYQRRAKQRQHGLLPVFEERQHNFHNESGATFIINNTSTNCLPKSCS